jgi:hypothetical protein
MVKSCGEEDGHEKVEEGAGVSGLKVLGWSEGEHAEVVELPSLLNSKIIRSYARCSGRAYRLCTSACGTLDFPG